VTAHEAPAALATKLVSSVDYMEAVLRRIDELDPHLHAFTFVASDTASAEAKPPRSA